MKKRAFQILDEMNLSDSENNTRLVSISNSFISGDKVKQGAKICMGTSEQVLIEIMSGKVIPLLLTIDKDEYASRNKEIKKSGVDLIAEERKRQIEVEGYTLDHDKDYQDDELSKAAACYALPESTRDLYPCSWRITVPEFFPSWDNEFWKPTPENRIKELTKAGALIAAEIDRINS